MKRFFGGILLALGILIAGLSGLCTIVFVGWSLMWTGQYTHPLDMAGTSLLIGAIPISIGVGLIVAGRALLKKS